MWLDGRTSHLIKTRQLFALLTPRSMLWNTKTSLDCAYEEVTAICNCQLYAGGSGTHCQLATLDAGDGCLGSLRHSCHRYHNMPVSQCWSLKLPLDIPPPTWLDKLHLDRMIGQQSTSVFWANCVILILGSSAWMAFRCASAIKISWAD